MPAVVTFDGVNRRITEINTGLASNTLDLVEVYSEWKEWAQSSSANAGIVSAFRYTGADPISDIQNTGTSFFLRYGWKFVPADYKHQLIIQGNLFTDPAGGERTDFDTITAAGIEVVYEVSNLVDSSVARLDLAQLQEAVYIDVNNGDTALNGADGTPTSPFNNEADALAQAQSDKLRAYSIISTSPISLNNDYTDWKFTNTISSDDAFLDLNGKSFVRCAFEGVDITGSAGNSAIYASGCRFSNVTNCLGTVRRSGVTSIFSAGTGGKLSLIDCYSDIPGNTKPIIDLSDNQADNFQMRGYRGGVELRNVDMPSQAVSLDIDSGDVYIDDTCTDGVIIIRGSCTWSKGASATSTIVDKTMPTATNNYPVVDATAGGALATQLEKLDRLIAHLETSINTVSARDAQGRPTAGQKIVYPTTADRDLDQNRITTITEEGTYNLPGSDDVYKRGT